MKERPFGPARLLVPVVGQGTWDLERGDRREAIGALRRGLDLGLRHVDTAEMYGSGRVEEIVGEAITGRRDDVFLVSKVLPSNASEKGTVEACERSLRRLRTDRLDVYLLHWKGGARLDAVFRAFDRLEADGKIRAFGVSNFDVADLEEARRLVGAERIACNQVLYHLGERSIEHEVLPWCETQGVALVAYSPFGSGRDVRFANDPAVREVARRHGISPYAVALAFLARAPSVFAIPKAATVAHVEENARAADLELDEGDRSRIEAAFPRGPRRRGVPTL